MVFLWSPGDSGAFSGWGSSARMLRWLKAVRVLLVCCWCFVGHGVQASFIVPTTKEADMPGYSFSKQYASVCALVVLIGGGFFAPPATANRPTPGPAVSAKARPVLDRDTDIAVAIKTSPVVSRGVGFRATVSVTNIGRFPAKWVTCEVATPRADAVSNLQISVPTRKTYDPVEGNESNVFLVSQLKLER